MVTVDSGRRTTTAPGAGTGARPRLVHLESLVDELVADATRRTAARTQGVARGPVTGLASLDKLLGDCLEPGRHVLHGGPGVGKSALALQIASDCGCPAVVVTTEMRPLELLRRLVARQTSTFLGDLKNGSIAPTTVRQKAQAAIARVPQLALVDACDAYADPEFLYRAAVGARESAGAAHVLLVVDSVHSWSEAAPDRRALTEYERLGEALDGLGALASRLASPALLIAERNRQSVRDGGLYASAGNRAFEYSCESMLSLDVAEQATPPGPDEKVILVRLEKNRHGPSHGKGLRLAFHGGLQRFRDLEPAPAGSAR